MYLNTILESAINLEEGYVEVTHTFGTLYGQVDDASMDGDMIGFVNAANQEVIYLSKQHIVSVKFVDVLPSPLDGGPEIPEEE